MIAQQALGWVLATGLAALVLAHPALADRAMLHAGLVVLVGALWALVLAAAQGHRAGWRSPVWLWLPAVAMLGGAALSLGFAPVPRWLGLGVLAGQLLFVWVGWGLVRRVPGLMAVLVWVVLGGAAVLGLYALVQYWGLDPLPRATGFGDRVVSFLDNPNHLGAFEGMVLPLALAAFFRAPEPRDRALLLGLVAAIYAGLLLSATRGAWVGTVAGCTVLLAGLGLQMRRRVVRFRPAWAAALVLALLAITVALKDGTVSTATGPVTLQERLRQSANIVGEQARTDYSVSHRYRIWQVTWEMIRERPLLGQGPGAYRDAFVRLRQALQAKGAFPVEGWNSFFDVDYAHNEYLHLWSESGLLALAGFIGLVCGVLLIGLRTAWRHQGEALLLWGGLGLLAVALVHGLVGYPLQVPLSGTLFWLALGSLAGLSEPRNHVW